MRYVFAIILGLMLFSCSDKDSNKNNPIVPTDSNTTFSFDSLVIDKKVIFTDETAEITAYARGSNLKYKWKANPGIVFGEGTKVTYTLCHEVVSEIICTVSDDKGNSKTLKDTVTVKQKL